MVYFIESGQIKLVMFSSEGKECLLAIYSAGDIFGELYMSRIGGRLETATAMEETIGVMLIIVLILFLIGQLLRLLETLQVRLT